MPCGIQSCEWLIYFFAGIFHAYHMILYGSVASSWNMNNSGIATTILGLLQ